MYSHKAEVVRLLTLSAQANENQLIAQKIYRLGKSLRKFTV